MTLEELNVKITADMKDLKKQLEASEKKVDQFATQVTQSNAKIEKSYNSMAAAIPWAAIAAGLAKIAKAAIEAASALEEVQNVVDVSFGKNAGQINSWAKQMKDSFGLSERAAKEYASTFKTIGDSMGLSDTASGTMAKNLTQLSADMASFYNSTAESTATALEAIYTGNAQALKQYGIVLSETTLEEYAQSQGIKQKYSEMSQAEKVLLRYNYVMKATEKSQGDFTRTSDSVANQLKLLKENGNELLQQLGTALQPVTQTLLKNANELVPALSELIQSFGELTEASQPLTEVVTMIVKDDLVAIMKSLSSIFKGMAPAVEAIGKAVGPLIELVNAVAMLPVTTFNLLVDLLTGTREVIEEVKELEKVSLIYETIDEATAIAADNMAEAVEQTKELRHLIAGFDELNIFKQLQKITGNGGNVTNNTYNNNTIINNNTYNSGSGNTFSNPDTQRGFEKLQQNGVAGYLAGLGITDLTEQDVKVLSVIPNFNYEGLDPVLPDGFVAGKLGQVIESEEEKQARLLEQIADNTANNADFFGNLLGIGNRFGGNTGGRRDLIIIEDTQRLTGNGGGGR